LGEVGKKDSADDTYRGDADECIGAHSAETKIPDSLDVVNKEV
jgi:hypothetical protein